MGVPESGLARMCGIDKKSLNQNAAMWNEGRQSPRLLCAPPNIIQPPSGGFFASESSYSNLWNALLFRDFQQNTPRLVKTFTGV